MRDAADTISKCPAAAPAYLKGRVERGEALPEVEIAVDGPREVGPSVSREGGGEGSEGTGSCVKGEEELQAVVRFVVTELKSELVVELMQWLRPKWTYTESS